MTNTDRLTELTDAVKDYQAAKQNKIASREWADHLRTQARDMGERSESREAVAEAAGIEHERRFTVKDAAKRVLECQRALRASDPSYDIQRPWICPHCLEEHFGDYRGNRRLFCDYCQNQM